MPDPLHAPASPEEPAIRRIARWSDTVAWAAAILGTVAVIFVTLAAGGGGWWWTVDAAAFVALGGALVGLDQNARTRARAAHLQDLLSHISRGLPDALFELSPDGSFRLATQSIRRLTGVPHTAVRGRRITDFADSALPLMTPDGPEYVIWTTTWRMPDGSSEPISMRLDPVWDGDRLTSIRGIIRDHSDRQAVEEALSQSEARFRRVIDASQNGLMLVSMDGRVLLSNKALRSLLGYSPSEMATRSLPELTHRPYIDQIMALIASCLWSDVSSSAYEVQLLNHTHALVDVEISLAALREGKVGTSVLIEVRDLTDARRTSSVIRRMADYDRLTGLPNRDLFDRHLQRALIDARADSSLVGVLLIDLDRFKLINDTLGHPSGDRLLRAVAERLRAHLPERHMVARFSGDEYIVLCPGLATVASAETEARRVLGAFTEAFEHDGHHLQISATVGVSVSPTHAEDADTLIRLADAALHEAKAGGGNSHRIGSNDAGDPALRRLELDADLRVAVASGDLRLHYQPQVDPRTGEVLVLESLLRWTHSTRGAVSPDEFVPLLEETGLIVAVGEMVLRDACRQARLWRDAGHDRVRVAVNVSPRQFVGTSLAKHIADALQDAGLPPDALEIELTESAGLLDFDSVVEVIEGLAKLGVTTAIDDFGIGHSWFGRLQRFPITTLKIDRSFIQRMDVSGNDLAIVEAVVALGHALGMSVVAEGVETDEQLDAVTSIGCDLVQGHYYSPAVQADRVSAILTQGFAHRAGPPTPRAEGSAA